MIVRHHYLGEGYKMLTKRFQPYVFYCEEHSEEMETTGTVVAKAWSRRVTKLADKQKQRIVRAVKANPQTSSKELLHDLGADGFSVQRLTIQCTLHFWTNQCHFGIKSCGLMKLKLSYLDITRSYMHRVCRTQLCKTNTSIQ